MLLQPPPASHRTAALLCQDHFASHLLALYLSRSSCSQAEKAAQAAREAAELGLQAAVSKTFAHKKMDKAAAATPNLAAPAAAPAGAGGKAAATAAVDAKAKGGKAAAGKAAAGKKH